MDWNDARGNGEPVSLVSSSEDKIRGKSLKKVPW